MADVSTEGWMEQQRAKALYRDTDIRQLSTKMLDMSPTNRIVTSKQAKLLLLLRMLDAKLSRDFTVLSRSGSEKKSAWHWLSWLADMFEAYQLTVGAPENSRKSFIDALKVELQTQEVKKKSVWTGQ